MSICSLVRFLITRPWRDFGATMYLLAALVPRKHENRPDFEVGRLHYSLRPTLSAHFRWGIRAFEHLDIAS